MDTMYYTNVFDKLIEKDDRKFPLIAKTIDQSIDWSNKEVSVLNDMLAGKKFKKMKKIDKYLQEQQEKTLKILKETERQKHEMKELAHQKDARKKFLELNWAKLQFDKLITEQDENKKRTIIRRMTARFSTGIESKPSQEIFLTLDSQAEQTKSNINNTQSSTQQQITCLSERELSCKINLKKSFLKEEADRCVSFPTFRNAFQEGRNNIKLCPNTHKVVFKNKSPSSQNAMYVNTMTLSPRTQETLSNLETKCEEVTHLSKSFPVELANNFRTYNDHLFFERNPRNDPHNPLQEIIPLRTERNALLPISCYSRPGYCIQRNNEQILQEGLYIKKIDSNLAYDARKVIGNRLNIKLEGIFEKSNNKSAYCQKLNKQIKLIADILEKSHKAAKVVRKGIDKYFEKNYL